MKHLLLVVVFALTGTMAQAMNLQHDLSNTYTQFYHSDIDALFGINGRVHSTVYVNKDVVSLQVLKRINGQFQHVLSASLPIVSVAKSCGSTIIVAMSLPKAVDTLSEKIVLADHSTRLCKDRVPFVTEVNYTTVAPRSQVETESYFGGPALQDSYE